MRYIPKHNKPHSEETKKILSEKQKRRWSLGIAGPIHRRTPEQNVANRDRQRKGVFNNCEVCGIEFYCSPSFKHQKYCSKKCNGKGKSGINSPVWAGGTSRYYKNGYYSKEYINWRKSVFARDNFTCQWCGKMGYITTHHIKSFAYYPELRFELSNGLTLCEECHKKTDNYMGRARKCKRT